MGKTSIEILFEWFDQTTGMIQKHKDEPYLDSLALSMETLFHKRPNEAMDDLLFDQLKNKLTEINSIEFSQEEIQKAIQLAILKGMRKSTQAHHMMTPETIALLIGYLAERFTKDQKNLRVFDPVCGTGSMLATVLNSLNGVEQAFGSEIDPTLLKLALYQANLLKLPIEFFHQDSLRPFLMDPVDLVVADLPVGYYPDDEHAKNFILRSERGHSYAHHLIIEQSMKYTKNSGYLIFLVPEFIFESDQSKKLNQYIRDHAHIVGLLRLPESAFVLKQNIKSILILQKKGTETTMPEQPLLVDFPSFKNTVAVEDILGKINLWFENYYKNN